MGHGGSLVVIIIHLPWWHHLNGLYFCHGYHLWPIASGGYHDNLDERYLTFCFIFMTKIIYMIYMIFMLYSVSVFNFRFMVKQICLLILPGTLVRKKTIWIHFMDCEEFLSASSSTVIMSWFLWLEANVFCCQLVYHLNNFCILMYISFIIF